MTDLERLRHALLLDPADAVLWRAYGDAFEERYGIDARRALAWRRVRWGRSGGTDRRWNAIERDLRACGVRAPGLVRGLMGFLGPCSGCVLRFGMLHHLTATTSHALLEGYHRGWMLGIVRGSPLARLAFSRGREVGLAASAPPAWGVARQGLFDGPVKGLWYTRKQAKRGVGLATLNLLRAEAGLPKLREPEGVVPC